LQPALDIDDSIALGVYQLQPDSRLLRLTSGDETRDLVVEAEQRITVGAPQALRSYGR
jgi:hypothetical protein